MPEQKQHVFVFLPAQGRIKYHDVDAGGREATMKRGALADWMGRAIAGGIIVATKDGELAKTRVVEVIVTLEEV
jgi:hypothetical protein